MGTTADVHPVSQAWRPKYLKRHVLVAFVVVFILVIVAIEALLAASNKSDGLATTDHSQHYLWTYGPSALLTLITAIWARVEYQTKLIAPWKRLKAGCAKPQQTLLLDYMSDFQPLAVFRALRGRDWEVAITCANSLLLKILIIISTGLITLSWTSVHQKEQPMMVQDAFSLDSTRLPRTGQLSYYVMRGLLERNLTYPYGISRDYAYQSVHANVSASTEIDFTVDKLTNGLDCVTGDVIMTGASPPDLRESGRTMNLTVTSPGCDIKDLKLETSPGWYH